MDSIKNSNSAIFAEKYRPHTLNEVINQKHVVERLKAFVKAGNVPHMIFAGKAGIGKTAAALSLSYDLYGKNWRMNVLELNASDERKLETVRGKIKDFARVRPFGNVPFKLLILDEADNLTADSQQALRRIIENFSSVTRFILICNWSSRIIEPLQSRAAVFRFKPLSEADQKKFIDRIVNNEKLKIDDDAVKAIIYLAEGDLRKVANLLQACAALKEKITESVVYDVASQAKPADVKRMLETALDGRFEDSRLLLQGMLLKQGLAGNDIIREIHRQIHSLDVDERTKIRLIEKTGEYEYRLSEGSSDLLQLEALLAQFLLFGKK